MAVHIWEKVLLGQFFRFKNKRQIIFCRWVSYEILGLCSELARQYFSQICTGWLWVAFVRSHHIWRQYDGICRKYEGICEEYEGICRKYVRICGKYEGIWRKYDAIYEKIWRNMRKYVLYMGLGTWKNSTPELPPGLWNLEKFRSSSLHLRIRR